MICSADGCDWPVIARGFCGKHYQRWRKTANDREVRRHAKSAEVREFFKGALKFKGEDCLPWPFGKRGGQNGRDYGIITVNGSQEYVTRVICERLYGPPAPKQEVAHSCNNRGCVNPAHLRWASRKENQSDRIIHGTTNRGEQHGASKLTAEDVLAIRALQDLGTTRGVGAQFGVCGSHVWQIWAGKQWGWLKGD